MSNTLIFKWPVFPCVFIRFGILKCATQMFQIMNKLPYFLWEKKQKTTDADDASNMLFSCWQSAYYHDIWGKRVQKDIKNSKQPWSTMKDFLLICWIVHSKAVLLFLGLTLMNIIILIHSIPHLSFFTYPFSIALNAPRAQRYSLQKWD